MRFQLFWLRNVLGAYKAEEQAAKEAESAALALADEEKRADITTHSDKVQIGFAMFDD